MLCQCVYEDGHGYAQGHGQGQKHAHGSRYGHGHERTGTGTRSRWRTRTRTWRWTRTPDMNHVTKSSESHHIHLCKKRTLTFSWTDSYLVPVFLPKFPAFFGIPRKYKLIPKNFRHSRNSRNSLLWTPYLAVMFWTSCPFIPVLSVFSWRSSLAVPPQSQLSRQSCSCPKGPVINILSQLYYPGSPVLAVLSWLSSSGRPVLSFLARLCYPDYVPRLSWPGRQGWLRMSDPTLKSRFLASWFLLSLIVIGMSEV